MDATRPVRGDLDSTGPIGWAVGDDVTTLARDLAGAAASQASWAAELGAASWRVQAAAHAGHAVIGFIEYLPPRAEGLRKWLTEPDANDGG